MFVRVEKNSDQTIFMGIKYKTFRNLYNWTKLRMSNDKHVLKKSRNPFVCSITHFSLVRFFKDVESLKFSLLIGVNLLCNIHASRKESACNRKRK